MNQREIDVIKARYKAATPGPWYSEPDPVDGGFHIFTQTVWIAHCYERESAAFITHAREDVPALVAKAERLWAELEQMKREQGQTYCAYCGATFEVDAPNCAEAVGEHIRTCEKHPLHDAMREVRRLEAEVERLRAELAANGAECQRQLDRWRAAAEAQFIEAERLRTELIRRQGEWQRPTSALNYDTDDWSADRGDPLT